MNRIPAIVRWLFGNARRYRLHLVLSMSLASLSAILSIVPMLCAYGLARQFFGEEAFSQSWQTTILALGICSIILRCVFYYLAMIFSHICAYGMHYDLRSRIAAHLALLPMGFFDRKSSGGIKKIMGADIEDMEAFIAHYVPDALSALVLPIVTAAVLFSVNAEMAVAPIKTGDIWMYAFHGWVLVAVMLFAVLTSWDLKYVGKEGEPVKVNPKAIKQ